MILKLTLNDEQLHALHEVLKHRDNKCSRHKDVNPQNFVWIKSVKASGENGKPVPRYEITLEVATSYETPDGWKTTPTEKLMAILQAMKIFSTDTEFPEDSVKDERKTSPDPDDPDISAT